MCTLYNKRILITANKRIHIISAYFLAVASGKHMHLLTSLYGTTIPQVTELIGLCISKSKDSILIL